MKPRVIKRETDTHLELTLALFVDTVQLRLDKVLCLKCDICAKVCEVARAVRPRKNC